MAESQEDLWPEELFDPADPAPVVLLKEQAALLRGRTNGELEGVVRTSVDNGILHYSLHLKANTTGDHLYKILDISYPTIGSVEDYPILARGADDPFSDNIDDHQQFQDWLRKKLASKYVMSALGNLRRYARERRSTHAR